jgi:16S rRNA (uracil1498-N3)-methyltransferase
VSRTARFHVDELPSEEGARLTLESEEAHHAISVLRLIPGSEVELFDGEGGAGRFRVLEAGKRGLSLALVARTDEDRESRCRVTLAFAPPRPKRTLSLIEKATELGVARFVPIETVRTRAALPARALPKLQRRAVEAAKQCGRNRLPTFGESVGLEALVAQEKAELNLLPDTVGGRPLREVVRGRDVRSVLFVIGPEGGFDDAERLVLRGAGFEPVVLGRSILRVETAALAVLACLSYELG